MTARAVQVRHMTDAERARLNAFDLDAFFTVCFDDVGQPFKWEIATDYEGAKKRADEINEGGRS